MQRFYVLLGLVVSFSGAIPAHADADKLAFVLKDHPFAIRSVIITPEGKILFAIDENFDLHWWDIASGEKHTLPLYGPKWLALSRDGKYIVSRDQLMATNFYWYSDETKLFPSTVSLLKGHQGTITSAAFSGDGKILVTATGKEDNGGEVRIWQAPAFKERLPRLDYTANVFFPKGGIGDLLGLPTNLRIPPGVERLALSADGTTLATVYASTKADELGSATAKIWNTKTGKVTGHVVAPGWTLHTLAFSSDGKALGLGLSKKNQEEIWIWDVAGEKPRRILKGPSAVQVVAFSPDGNRLAAGFADGIAIIWDVVNGNEVRSEKVAPNAGPVRDVSFTSDGQTLVVGGGKVGWIALWKMKR